MQINWDEFFSYRYWFVIDRLGLHKIDWAFLYLGAALVVIAVILMIYRSQQKNPFLKSPLSSFIHIFMTVGLLEGLWFAMRYQLAQALGSRIVALAILVIGLIWMIWPVKYLLGKFRDDNENYQRQLNKAKYIK